MYPSLSFDNYQLKAKIIPDYFEEIWDIQKYPNAGCIPKPKLIFPVQTGLRSRGNCQWNCWWEDCDVGGGLAYLRRGKEVTVAGVKWGQERT